MTDNNEELHYPHLISCRVILTGGTGSSKPPVRLPNDCFQAANSGIPPKDPTYDFSLERNVLKKLAEREQDPMFTKDTSRDELQLATLQRMKSVTGANDDVCISLLKSHGYDLKTSIEAFYQR